MTQPTFSAVRQALAAQLAAKVTYTAPDQSTQALRAVANRLGPVNPPTAIVMPVTGTFVRYSTAFGGSADPTLRVILLLSEGDAASGQDNIDPFIATTGPSSIWAAVQADPTLGGVVQSAGVTEVTAYGLMNWNGVDYLACHFIVPIMI